MTTQTEQMPYTQEAKDCVAADIRRLMYKWSGEDDGVFGIVNNWKVEATLDWNEDEEWCYDIHHEEIVSDGPTPVVYAMTNGEVTDNDERLTWNSGDTFPITLQEGGYEVIRERCEELINNIHVLMDYGITPEFSFTEARVKRGRLDINQYTDRRITKRRKPTKSAASQKKR